MSERGRFIGEVVRVPMESWKYDELRAQIYERLILSVDARINAARLTPTGETVVRPPQFLMVVKVQHHEHGWQLEDRETDEANATHVLLMAERAAVPAASVQP